jgi:hypothetical protein
VKIIWRVAMSVVIAAVVALTSAGAATADNSNSNTNNNDVTNLGGNGDLTGGSSESTGWPPTDLSWPPKDITSSGGDKSNDHAGNSTATAPIVMPSGQHAPSDTSEPAKPIVPVTTP